MSDPTVRLSTWPAKIHVLLSFPLPSPQTGCSSWALPSRARSRAPRYGTSLRRASRWRWVGHVLLVLVGDRGALWVASPMRSAVETRSAGQHSTGQHSIVRHSTVRQRQCSAAPRLHKMKCRPYKSSWQAGDCTRAGLKGMSIAWSPAAPRSSCCGGSSRLCSSSRRVLASQWDAPLQLHCKRQNENTTLKSSSCSRLLPPHVRACCSRPPGSWTPPAPSFSWF